MEGSCDMFKLFQVPDVVILLLTKYLDGPSACALTQTCLRFHLFVKSRYKLHISLRVAPKDYAWYIRRRLETAHICKYCLRIDKCNGSCRRELRKNRCESCGAQGTKMEQQPWKMYAFPPNVTCFKCRKPLETSKDYYMTEGCLKCHVTCRYCLGLIVKCDRASCTWEGSKRQLKQHQKTHPKTFWQSVCTTFSCSRDDDDETIIIYDDKYIINEPFAWRRIRPNSKKR